MNTRRGRVQDPKGFHHADSGICHIGAGRSPNPDDYVYPCAGYAEDLPTRFSILVSTTLLEEQQWQPFTFSRRF